MNSETGFLTGENPYENRVERTLAFVDLSGFTKYTDSEGDEAAVKLLTDFRLRVREIAARRGVRIAKWLGDGAMLVSVEPELITEAIIDMEEAFDHTPLKLRAGIASGPVILFEGDDYIGKAVNMAARLCAVAKPGEVLGTQSMVSTLMVNTNVTPIGPQYIEGFAEPVELVRLDSGDSDSGDSEA